MRPYPGNYSISEMHDAIKKLENPKVLESNRRRLEKSPSAYSDSDATEFENMEYPEEDPVEAARFKVESEQRQSHPPAQFTREVILEVTRLGRGETHYYLYYKEATQFVKDSWVKQGIWKNSWTDQLNEGLALRGRWGHEEPLAANEGVDRDASRPLLQFNFQVGVEFRRLIEDDVADAGSLAYKTVKSRWVEKGIWNDGWSILPGHQWKHEVPVESLLPADVTNITQDLKYDPEDKAKGQDSPASIIYRSVTPRSTSISPRSTSISSRSTSISPRSTSIAAANDCKHNDSAGSLSINLPENASTVGQQVRRSQRIKARQEMASRGHAAGKPEGIVKQANSNDKKRKKEKDVMEKGKGKDMMEKGKGKGRKKRT